MWDETEGKRGSCEISSCMYKYFKSLPLYVTHVTMYSDCCSGQNRNKYFLSMLLYILKMCPQIKTIDHKYFESGHSQSEVDSIYSYVESVRSMFNLCLAQMDGLM